ncbi:MAG: transcriptional regulator [Pseudomonadota bacterium]
MAAEPRCPGCDISGIEHIVSRESVERARNRLPWFHVVHCATCGHVYGVLTKHVFNQAATPRFVLPRAE